MCVRYPTSWTGRMEVFTWLPPWRTLFVIFLCVTPQQILTNGSPGQYLRACDRVGWRRTNIEPCIACWYKLNPKIICSFLLLSENETQCRPLDANKNFLVSFFFKFVKKDKLSWIMNYEKFLSTLCRFLFNKVMKCCQNYYVRRTL